MNKRMLDIRPSEAAKLSGKDLIESIRAAEGRSLVTEVIAPAPALFHDVSNAELATSMGADVLLLNMYDVDNPTLAGFDTEDAIPKTLEARTGRIIGINLEPVSSDAMMEEKRDVPKGQRATVENARKAFSQGVKLILLTGNPKTGVTNQRIKESLKAIKEALGDDIVLAAGKMHSSGIGGETASTIVTEDDVDDFLKTGADIILFPAPGTVPGIHESLLYPLVERVHKKGALAMSAIGTSQEGADSETIKTIALASKRLGVDLHHIGDAGYFGIAVPENITTYSIVIRGVRHTYRRMAMRG